MKKALRGDTNTALAVVRLSQKFSPRRRPSFRGRGTAKISSYRGNRSTNTQTNTPTNKPTDRTDYNTLHRS